MPKVSACGSRKEACDDFCTATRNAKDDEFPIMLVDSEEAVEPGANAWQHLKDRKSDGWDKPESASDENAHLMVQCMEAWFLADRNSLASYFGQGFSENALPKSEDVENIHKDDLFLYLRNATRSCKGKGQYSKDRHSYQILENLDHQKVANASPHAKRFFDTLRKIAVWTMLMSDPR